MSTSSFVRPKRSMLDCLKTAYEKGSERGGIYLDKPCAFLEDSFDDVLNFCGL
jgi:hypothetical protein